MTLVTLETAEVAEGFRFGPESIVWSGTLRGGSETELGQSGTSRRIRIT